MKSSTKADEQILTAESWWAANRPLAPELFREELLGAFDMLSNAPDIGRPYRRLKIPGLRRFLLPRTRYHVYYVHEVEPNRIIILAVWSAVRGRAPKLNYP